MSCRILWIALIAIDLGIFSVTTCPVYITEWLHGKNSYESGIEVHWGPSCETVPTWIGVFDQDPSVSDLPPKYSIETGNASSGHHVFEQRIGKFEFPGGWGRLNHPRNLTLPRKYPNGKCVKYYVASFQDKDLLSVNCFKIQPNWMRFNEHVADIPLKDLFIPGTHASGSYNDISNASPTYMKNYGHAQNFDVWTQLVFGIRYLDLSIGYRESENSDIINNFGIVNANIYIVVDLKKIFDDIKKFVQASGEVILLDFRSFPLGFFGHRERHMIFLNILEQEFGSIAFRRSSLMDKSQSFALTVNDIVKTGKHIVITYPLDKLDLSLEGTTLVWPSWSDFSSLGMNIPQTLDLMRTIFGKRSSSVGQSEGFVFYGIKPYEPNMTYYRESKLKTNREQAASINNKLTSWLRGAWSVSANVVATDFFLSSNLVELAIVSNRHKAFNLATNYTNFEVTE